MKRVLPWMLIVAVAASAAFAFLNLAVLAGRGGETAPLYAAQRFDPYGTAALFRLTQRRTEDTQTLERPRLPDGLRGVLVQVLPLDARDRHGFVQQDSMGDWAIPPDVYALPTQDLLEWVADGNTLVQLTRGHTPVMEALGVPRDASLDEVTADARRRVEFQQREADVPDDLPGLVIDAQWSDRFGRHTLTLHEPRRFDIPADADLKWTPLARRGLWVYGGVVRHGAGRVVLLGAPTPALNHQLAESDHLNWWLDQLGDGPVTFDEWAHGVGHGGTILETLAYFGLIPVLLQAAIWLGVYRWSTAGRTFVDPDADRAPPRTSSEQIDTLARLYGQSWDDSQRRRRTYDEVIARLAEAYRCAPAHLRDRLATRGDDAAQQALRLIDDARAVATHEPPRCPHCGYELRASRGDRCPECDTPIPLAVRRLIDRPELLDVSAADSNPNARKSGRIKTDHLADLLNQSAKLAEELRRARTARRYA